MSHKQIMMHTYRIVGYNWHTDIQLEEEDGVTIKEMVMEVCTKAVEALYERRNDILINFQEDPHTIDQSSLNQFQKAFFNLITTEIEEGCKLGAIICCLIDNSDEWYVNSKEILENASIPNLVHSYLKKFPTTT